FSIGQIGGRVTPELALESACCLALSELLAQSTPLRQILRLQLCGAKGMLLAGGRNQSDAATRQEHGRGYLTAARAPLVIPRCSEQVLQVVVGARDLRSRLAH